MELPVSIRPLKDLIDKAFTTVFVMPAAVILVISRCFLIGVKYLKSKWKIFAVFFEIFIINLNLNQN